MGIRLGEGRVIRPGPVPVAVALLVCACVPWFSEPAAATDGSRDWATEAAPADTVGAWGRGLGYGVTLSLDQARDDLLAPLCWRGPGFGLRGSWTWGGSDARHVLSLVVPISVLSNRFGHRGYALAPALGYGYLAQIARRRSRSSVWLGGRFRMDMFNGFYESWDDEHLYWMTAYSLGPTAAWRGRLGAYPAWLGLDLPLLAAVSRPQADRLNQIDRLTKFSGHFVDTQKNLSFATLPDYVALHASAGVVVRVAGRSLSLSYDLDWSTYATPSRFSVLRHRLTVGHHASR